MMTPAAVLERDYEKALLLARRLVGPSRHTTAEDVVQDACLKLLRGQASFLAERHGSAPLLVAVRSVVIDHWRSARSRERAIPTCPLEPDHPGLPSSPSAEDVALSRHIDRRLLMALAGVKRNYRRQVWRRAFVAVPRPTARHRDRAGAAVRALLAVA